MSSPSAVADTIDFCLQAAAAAIATMSGMMVAALAAAEILT